MHPSLTPLLSTILIALLMLACSLLCIVLRAIALCTLAGRAFRQLCGDEAPDGVMVTLGSKRRREFEGVMPTNLKRHKNETNIIHVGLKRRQEQEKSPVPKRHRSGFTLYEEVWV